MKTVTVECLLGTCPICEGTFKLHKECMVHHGYQRPGDGYIHGDCFAVGHPPYEVSCEVTKVFRGMMESRRDAVQKTLASYKAGEITHFTENRIKRVGFGRSELETTEYVLGVTEPYTWKRAFNARVSEMEYNLRGIEREIERLTGLIDKWEPRDIRTVMEEKIRLEKAERAAKEAERQAKRDERAAKEAAKKAKREALEAKRAGIKKGVEDGFEALAKQPKSAERDEAVYKLRQKVVKSGFLWWHQLKCGEALVALGLATMEDGRVYYRG